MREILFRAKRIDDGEWVEGYYVKTTLGKDIKPSDVIFVPWKINRSEQWGWIKVLPETICQFTGLHDKNGNRIWENDIVSINTYSYMEPEEDYFGKIVYVEGWGCWCIQQPDDEKPIPLCECEGSYQTDRFVEGNVFDNPEMWRKETED